MPGLPTGLCCYHHSPQGTAVGISRTGSYTSTSTFSAWKGTRIPNSPLQDIDRNVLLISHLGSEGLRSFSTTQDFAEYSNPANPTTYQSLKKMVQEHVRTTPSVVKARFDFVSRTQEPGESVAEYLVALRALLPDCACGRIPAAVFEDVQLKTQLICHTSDSRARLEIFARRAPCHSGTWSTS